MSRVLLLLLDNEAEHRIELLPCCGLAGEIVVKALSVTLEPNP